MAFSLRAPRALRSTSFSLAARGAGGSPLRFGRQLGFARDHHLGGLDDRDGFVAAAQLQLLDGVAGDHGREPLVADAQAHLPEQAVAPDFLHEPAQPVAAAERHDQAGRT